MTIGGRPSLRHAPRFAFRRWAAVALVVGSQGACAALAGLDSYSSGDVGDATVATGKDGAARDSARAEAAASAETSTYSEAAAEPEGEDDAGIDSGDDANSLSSDADDDAELPETGAEGSAPGADAQAESGVDASSSGVDAGPPCDGGPVCSGQCVDTTSDPLNCGGCGQACTPANVGHGRCVNSTCSYDTCGTGFGDCDGNRANGCEANLTDPSHCGSCTTSCSTGLCGTSISGWSPSATLWTLNGSTTLGSGPLGGSTAFLTTATASQAGTIVYAHPIVTDAFTATFTIYLGGGGGGDGMGFMWQTQGATGLGGSGGCLGMCGLPGYGVEFDTYNNAVCGDTNSNHIAVDELTGCSMAYPTHITASGASLPMLDGTSRVVVVTLASGKVSVTIDGTSQLSNVALTGFTSGTPSYFGFAGGTGGATDAHEVSPTLSITFPTPRCL